jgi:hypothetical protein
MPDVDDQIGDLGVKHNLGHEPQGPGLAAASLRVDQDQMELA